MICNPVLTFVVQTRWFADQIGAFEIHPSVDGKKSLKQMVGELPIGWSDQGTRGPMTLIGMREWQDIQAGGMVLMALLGEEEGVLGGKCCLQQFPCCYCFTDVADCRCRWISSCLRRMLASRLKRHVQQMPFPLTSLISSAWASPRAACFAFRVRLYKSCVATSYHPECSYEIHAKNPNPPDARERRPCFLFVRIYPVLAYLPILHIVCRAFWLPFVGSLR